MCSTNSTREQRRGRRGPLGGWRVSAADSASDKELLVSLSSWDVGGDDRQHASNVRPPQHLSRGVVRGRGRGGREQHVVMSLPSAFLPPRSDVSDSSISMAATPQRQATAGGDDRGGELTSGGCSGNPSEAVQPVVADILEERFVDGQDRLALLHRRSGARSPAISSRPPSERGRRTPALKRESEAAMSCP